MALDKRQDLTQTTGDDYLKFLLEYARERLAANNFYDADFALQVYSSRTAMTPAAYNLRAMVAYGLGLYEHALVYVDNALELRPSFARAQENKSKIEAILKREKSEDGENLEEKYFLIHSWGSGFGFDLLYLLQQLLLAEMSQRTPVIHWGVNSVYNDTPEKDCFTNFFEPINTLKIDDVVQYGDNAYPEHWQKRELHDFIRRTRWKNTGNKQAYKIGGPYYLGRQEKLVVGGEFSSIKLLLPWIVERSPYVEKLEEENPISAIYRELLKKYIKPKQHLLDRASYFVEKAFPSSEHYLAIHIRGTDKHNEAQSSSIADINEQLMSSLEKHSQELPIFLMTDDVRQLAVMQQRFGDRVKSMDVIRGDSDDIGIHLSGNEKNRMAEEVLVDMLVASKAEHFFGCGFSYLACVVSYMRESDEGSTLLSYDAMTRFMNVPVRS